MQDYFYELSDEITQLLKGKEAFTATFHAEDSDFVRFNQAKVRQAGTVHQKSLSIDLIEGQRHVGGSLTLSGDKVLDKAQVASLFEKLREQRGVLAEDPHLLFAEEVHSSEVHAENELPAGSDAIASIQAGAGDKDLVGIYAAGGVHAGFANSFGQRNWYTNYNFNFDWSFYHSTDKAVKSSHSGFKWDAGAFDNKIELATEQLGALGHAPRTIDPGRYRAYLSPAALADIVEMVASEGFGLKALKTKQTPLLRMYEDEAKLNSAVNLVEATADGVAPNFQSAGFIKPERVNLIHEGRFAENLISPRSAREYGVETNGASSSESPESIQVGAGSLSQAKALQELGTGIWIGNVWYLNYSDRSNCRTTGMTRFATFWVENGQIQAPLNVMRFDETIFRILGDNLIGLTAEREWMMDPQTYGGRSTNSALIPGALVDDFTFTL